MPDENEQALAQLRAERPWDIDLGENHFLQFFEWSPDRNLNPQYEGLADLNRAGAIVGHLNSKGEMCVSAITFRFPNYPTHQKSWVVEDWEPLTLGSSLACRAEGCNDHGFIREGKWVKA